jgi:hypothetical protein
MAILAALLLFSPSTGLLPTLLLGLPLSTLLSPLRPLATSLVWIVIPWWRTRSSPIRRRAMWGSAAAFQNLVCPVDDLQVVFRGTALSAGPRESVWVKQHRQASIRRLNLR